MTRAQPHAPFCLLTGCGRSGTRYIALLANELGRRIGHEQPGKDGIASWVMAVEDDRAPGYAMPTGVGKGRGDDMWLPRSGGRCRYGSAERGIAVADQRRTSSRMRLRAQVQKSGLIQMGFSPVKGFERVKHCVRLADIRRR